MAPPKSGEGEGEEANATPPPAQSGESSESRPMKKSKVEEKLDDGPLPMAEDSEWPEAWYMTEGECKNQKEPNKQDPNVPVDAAAMKKLGINYWKFDADAYSYPVLAVPWDPKDAVDPKLAKLRDDRGYSYADIITIHPDKLPNYDEKVKNFFTEHIHDAEEIRYIISGSGFFDVRDTNDKWVRIHVKKGDLMTLPEGIYHRFTVDEKDIIHAMRLFIGEPVWTPFDRPADDHASRKKYVEQYVPAVETKAE